jgi:hypothetical protein
LHVLAAKLRPASTIILKTNGCEGLWTADGQAWGGLGTLGRGGLQEGFYIDGEHERDETLIRAAELQLAAATSSVVAADASEHGCRCSSSKLPEGLRRMTTRILEVGGFAFSRGAFAAGS